MANHFDINEIILRKNFKNQHPVYNGVLLDR